MRLIRDSFILMLRSLRESARQPAIEVGNLFIPLFFFAVTVGAISSISEGAFGVKNFTGFQLPVAMLQAIAGSAVAGAGLVTDIQKGYFDKLALTPTPRPSLVLGRMLADAVRAIVLVAVIIAVGLLTGAGMESGPLGAVVLLLMAACFSLAYTGFAVSLALKTASNQAVQLSFLLFFPLLFLAPTLAPKEVFTGWLEFLATINPVTYILEGSRSLVLDGWEPDRLLKAFAAIVGFAAVTSSMTVWAYRTRKV
ncbi:MAG: ABC transporter permease [Dehalococcoidia bacterium]